MAVFYKLPTAILVLLFISNSEARIDSSTADEFNSNIRTGYNPLHRPGGGRNDEIRIQVSMYIQDAKWNDHVLTSWFYLRQTWKDDRLASSTREDSAIYGPEMESKIWLPDTYFPSAMSYERFEREGSIKVDQLGNVRWSQRIKMQSACVAPVARLSETNPHRVNCTMAIESYAFTADKLSYQWKMGPTITESASIIHRVHQDMQTIRLNTGLYGRLNVFLYVETQPLYNLESCIHQCFRGKIDK